jgi:hypothetical protein
MQAGRGGALVPLLWRSDGDRGRVFLNCRQGSAARQFAESDLNGQMLAAAIDRETKLHGMEGIRGSNPLSSTQLRGGFTVGEPAFLIFWQQQAAATVRVSQWLK